MYDLIVIGGGPAGLAAALAAWDRGLRNILILERDLELGGILNQCIHNGFGLHHFGEELTGPEYAACFIRQLEATDIQVWLDTMVLQITPDRQVHAVSKTHGYRVLQSKAILLAMGCRERTRGAIGIPGTRPAGVLTAGTAQRYVNMEGYMVGKRVLVLGSGDIGLIMARRMTLEGAEVLACVEVMPYSGGLTRNIVQCLNDYGIPLLLSHTVVEIRGERRVEQAVVARVDENRQPISGTEQVFHCDTILLSVGLIPENELSRDAGIAMDERTGGALVNQDMETSIPGIFACGNAVHVHDLVDFVTEESIRAGTAAARFVLEPSQAAPAGIPIETGDLVSYTVPQRIQPDKTGDHVDLFFRVRKPMEQSRVVIRSGDSQLAVFRRQHLAPGEMERVQIPRKLLERAESSIHITVEEDVS